MLYEIAFDYFGLDLIISESKTCGSRRVSEADFPRCCTAVIPPVQEFAQGGRGGQLVMMMVVGVVLVFGMTMMMMVMMVVVVGIDAAMVVLKR